MKNISPLKDSAFLLKLDKEKNRHTYIKILVLDFETETPLRSIEGRVTSGSISINGQSNVRRTGSVNLIASEAENDLADVENFLSINTKIKILIGIENNIDSNYDDIIWYKQGIFIITQPTITHNLQGVNISLQFKDKMCLLNGEFGGNLPVSVTFHEYIQKIGIDTTIRTEYPADPNLYTIYTVNDKNKGKIVTVMWNEVQGWYDVDKSILDSDKTNTITVANKIYDIIQTAVANFGKESLDRIIINDVPLQVKNHCRYIGSHSLYYNELTGIYTQNEDQATDANWQVFDYNEDCGYMYTDFTYAGSGGLISNIGENVCSVLEKIKNAMLGNYEYFYDIDGNFVFQEKKNYLNTTYDPVQKLDLQGFLLDSDNYYIDRSTYSPSVYTFEEGSTLINAYQNVPNFSNIKNDYHILGKTTAGEKEIAIHYHLVIKAKPTPPYQTYKVVYLGDGKLRLATNADTKFETYTPTDWRAAIYMSGLDKQSRFERPDIYEQELLDLFDDIYNMEKKEFKVDIVNNINNLHYWIDYINPEGLYDISVDNIGTKSYTYQEDGIKKLYDGDIPDLILLNGGADISAQSAVIAKCLQEAQPYSRVQPAIYNNLAQNTYGYTAKNTARDLLYQYTNYANSITLTSMPIYYLEPNTRITVNDRASNLFGDFVINSITLPLDAKSFMTVQATAALERV